MRKFKNLIWGLLLVLVGCILGLNALEITNIDIFFDGWWTLFIIVPCFIGVFEKDNKTSNFVGLIIGLGLLLCCQDVLDFDILWKLLIPIILVVIGLSIIFKDTFDRKIGSEIKKINEKHKNSDEYCATFSGQEINFDNEEFKGTTLTAVFGEVKCDLRGAIIKEDQVINCSAIFGGIDIFVPANVKVKIKSNSAFGGVSNEKRRNPEGNAKTIYINATCVFGGVEIK